MTAITHQAIADRVAEVHRECETVSDKAHARAKAELQSLQELCSRIGHDFAEWSNVCWTKFVPEPATSGIDRARYCQVCEFEEREPVAAVVVQRASIAQQIREFDSHLPSVSVRPEPGIANRYESATFISF